MKAEKRLDRFKYIFPQRPTGPLFHHFIMNLSGKAFNIHVGILSILLKKGFENRFWESFWQEFQQVHLKAKK